MTEKITLTDKEEIFLEALFSTECKGDVHLAKVIAGWSKNYDVYASLIPKLKDIIRERAESMLIANAAQSVMILVDVAQNPSGRNAGLAKGAAESILDRGAGLVKKQVIDVQIDSPNALLILPDLDKDE